MYTTRREKGKYVNGRRILFQAFLFFLLVLPFLFTGTFAAADVTVTVSGPGGQNSQIIPGDGGSFDLNLPLNRNAVNKILVTATDGLGNTASKEISVTQVSLDSIVVSRVTSERLSIEEVTRLVNEGVINLSNPENYNVSRFDIVLTIANAQVPISLPIAVPINGEVDTGWETYRMPSGEDSGGRPPGSPPVEVILFDKIIPGPPGEPAISIPGVIIIEGRIKSLKEFFAVRLLLMNTSGIFTLKNVMSNIEFPDGGLSNVTPADGILSFGDILPGDGSQPGQSERQFIIRGDQIGVRNVRVNFAGTVAGPGIPDDALIPFNGSALTSVEVKGPPTFQVQVFHPDNSEAGTPYELRVDVINTGDLPAMYASIELDVGVDARIVRCETDAGGNPVCTPIEGSDVRNLGHILPGQKISEIFTIEPLKSGLISSCMAVADQNITLQVFVGNLGCMVGQVPPDKGVQTGIPTVTVLPAPNAFGISPDSPVVAFFSEEMNEASITTGTGGTFNVYDDANNRVPGQILFETLNQKTVAVWQVNNGTTNRLEPDIEYTIVLKKENKDLDGNGLSNEWVSKFTTTDTGINDTTPPTIDLSVEPPVNPNAVLPGQIVRINAYASDQGSGVVRVELRSRDLDEPGGLYALIDQKVVFKGDKPPFIFLIDSAKLVAGHTYQLMGTAYDYMGNSQNATLSLIIAPSADPPTITLPQDPSDPVLRGISVSLTPLQVTGGVKEVQYFLDSASLPFKAVTLAPYQVSLTTLGLDPGSHTIRSVGIDGLGQTSEGQTTGKNTYTFNLIENLNRPVVSFPGSVSGAHYIIGASFPVRGDAQDPVGIQSVQLYLDAPNGTPIATTTQPVLINTTGLELGSHRVYIVATNNLGIMNDVNDPASYLVFSVLPVPAGNPPPPPTVNTISYPENGQVTLTGTSVPGARVDITNTNLGITLSVNVNGSGSFTGVIAADAGHLLNLIAYDFSQSQSPSTATPVVVPTPPVLDHIEVSPTSISFTSANAYQDLVVTGYYQGGGTANLTSKAAFSSSHPAVASVNGSGRVAAIGNGDATITVRVTGVPDAGVPVTVNIVVLTSITVDPLSIVLTSISQSRQLNVTGHYSNGSSQVLTSGISYGSGDINVATVNSTGLVTARGNGTTQVTVYYPGLPPVPVSVNVNTGEDPAPTAGIQSPANGTNVERGQNVSVSVRAQDTTPGGVTKIYLDVSGQTLLSDMKQVSPASLDTTQIFNFVVSNSAAIGGTLLVRAWAEDTSGNLSPIVSVTLNVVDNTAPSVTITAPATQALYNYGDTVDITVSATDAVGVTQIRYETTGALTFSGSKAITPASQSTTASFSFVIPFGVTDPDVRILAYARDGAGHEGAAIPVDIIITNADITPPETIVTSIANPGSNPTTTITYQVTSGLADLDHVELYFRRNGIGTFNRYTDADGGNPQGKFIPQSGNTGTILFDSTRMGGDGDYEFYTIGVDKAGNREPVPMTNAASPRDYSGLIAYYPFNGNALDESGNGNHGTINGAPFTEDRFGLADQALSFNGSGNYVSIGTPVPSGLQIQGEMTLAAWIYITQYPASDTLGTIVGCQHDSGNNTGYAIHLDGRTNPDGQPSPAGHIHFQIGDGGWHVTNANSQVPLNQWVHIVATRKADEDAKIYYNGIQQPSASVAWTGSIAYTNAELDIGRQSDFGNRYFNGRIDEVQIYNRALSETEILGFFSYFVPDKTVTFNSGTVWTEITTPTVIGEGDSTYDNQNIRVIGTTLTVNGNHTFHNMDLLQGAVLTHSPTTTSQEFNLILSSLWTLTIDGTSQIDLSGRGYLGGKGYNESGPTRNNTLGSAHGAGGSYGGKGGSYSGNIPNDVYGYINIAEDLGSGGGAWESYYGGNGGGLMKLTAINVAVDGSILANGAPSNGSAAGGGSGGGIHIVTKTLSGTGDIQSNGGGSSGSGVGGGGGRISIYYLDMETMNTSGIKALGSPGSYGTGANGTVFFKQELKANGDIIISGQGGGTAWTNLTLPPGFTFDSLTLRDSALVLADDPVTITGKLLVTGNSILSHTSGRENGLVIHASVVQVDEGSAIDATGKGYLGGKGYNEYGRTLGNVSGSQNGAGGSYGGMGAGYQSYTSNLLYGNPKNPDKLGSGGGAWESYYGGNGGGRITIHASQAVIVNGAIRSNGDSNAGSAAGGGSGGSVLIETSRLAGDGFITANGGGTGSGGVGGGGGRVALICDYIDPDHDLNNQYNITALRASGSYNNRMSNHGTVYIKYSNQVNGDLLVDGNVTDANGIPNGTSPESVVFTPIGFGSAAGVTVDTLTTNGLVPFLPGGLAGLRINPDVNQQETFFIQSNTANTITVVTPNEKSVSFGDVASTGKTYAGSYQFDNITLRRGGNLMIADQLHVVDTMDITEYGLLTHYDATTSAVYWMDLMVGNLIIDLTSRIDATGRGYLGGKGYNENGRTQGNALGSGYGTGGSYGGIGGKYSGSGGIPNPIYGSLTNPVDLGSGGGAWEGNPGGDGGGLILITASHVIVNGAITSNGVSAGSAAGGGSGGTVNLLVGDLEGTGTIQTNGGGVSGGGVGGGGGRIAIAYTGVLSLSEENIKALGAPGSYGTGGNGTLYIKGPGQTNGELIIDGQGNDTPQETTILPGGFVFDRITLKNKAYVKAVEQINVEDTLLITGNSILTADGGVLAGTLHVSGNSKLIHSVGLEAGLVIDATVIQVDAGSAIDATSKGYLGGKGYNESGRTLGNVSGSQNGAGGSYGGVGAGYQNKISNLIYGDPKNPDKLGSGGGAWEGYYGGNGGGRITLYASDQLIVNGAIRSNGGGSAGSAAGDGSGGSVWINAHRIGGTGFITANGGGYGVGGGGGRVAIYYDELDPLNNLDDLYNITAFGGVGPSYDDRKSTAGTIYLKQTGQGGTLYIDANVVDGNGNPNGTAVQSTPLPHIGFGTTEEVTPDTLTTDSLVPLMPNGLAGVRLNPDISQGETFAILSNTANTITVVTPNENGVAFQSLAAAGKTYSGMNRYDHITFRRGGNLVVGDLLEVPGTIQLSEYGLLTHYPIAPPFYSWLDLTAGNLIIDGHSRIDVSGRGYLGGKAYNESGRTLGNVSGSQNGAGGSYGGLGGKYSGSSGNPGPTYGSALNPVDYGSGGGAWEGSYGGDGGGLIFLEAETMVVDGSILSNGGESAGSAAGDGSGGTVNIVVGTLSGAGVISANGGGGGNGVGGGGGRIAVQYDTLNMGLGQITTNGGTGVYGNGSMGTIYTEQN